MKDHTLADAQLQCDETLGFGRSETFQNAAAGLLKTSDFAASSEDNGHREKTITAAEFSAFLNSKDIK